jgi:hypothetical protein
MLPLKQRSLNPPQSTVLATPWKGGQRQNPLLNLIVARAGLVVSFELAPPLIDAEHRRHWWIRAKGV